MSADAVLRELKHKTIHGCFVDMVPAGKENSEQIVALRNTERARYFFNQQAELTVEGQAAWFDAYQQRDNDIYWAVFDKAGVFLGVTRMYDIDPEKGTAEAGSTVMDETLCKEAPYALEACYLPICMMFDQLGVREVVTHTREDNAKVRSFNARLGVVDRRSLKINGADYIEAVFTPESLNRSMIENLLARWAARAAKAGRQAEKSITTEEPSKR